MNEKVSRISTASSRNEKEKRRVLRPNAKRKKARPPHQKTIKKTLRRTAAHSSSTAQVGNQRRAQGQGPGKDQSHALVRSRANHGQGREAGGARGPHPVPRAVAGFGRWTHPGTPLSFLLTVGTRPDMPDASSDVRYYTERAAPGARGTWACARAVLGALRAQNPAAGRQAVRPHASCHRYARARRRCAPPRRATL